MPFNTSMLQLFYINLIVLTTLEGLFLANIYIYMFYSSSLLGNEVLKKNVSALPLTLILNTKKMTTNTYLFKDLTVLLKSPGNLSLPKLVKDLKWYN